MPFACIPIVGAKVKEGQTKAGAPVKSSICLIFQIRELTYSLLKP